MSIIKRGRMMENKIQSKNRNINGPKNIINEYDDITKKDCINNKFKPLMIEANNPNIPILKGPKRR